MSINYSKYPKNWKTEIVPRILKRAWNRCEFCGLENGAVVYSLKIYVRVNGKYGFRTIWFRDKRDAERHAWLGSIKPVKVVLTVAHLDHDETNHDVKDERLKALCQYCHLKYDAKEKIKRIMASRSEIPNS